MSVEEIKGWALVAVEWLEASANSCQSEIELPVAVTVGACITMSGQMREAYAAPMSVARERYNDTETMLTATIEFLDQQYGIWQEAVRKLEEAWSAFTQAFGADPDVWEIQQAGLAIQNANSHYATLEGHLLNAIGNTKTARDESAAILVADQVESVGNRLQEAVGEAQSARAWCLAAIENIRNYIGRLG